MGEYEMGVFDGMQNKFTVVKNQDIQGLLEPAEQWEMQRMLRKIDDARFRRGKNINVYMVINIDEPYAPEVAGIMKGHGHWDAPNSDPNQIEAVFEGNILTLPMRHIGD